jgi:hypothetical protein
MPLLHIINFYANGQIQVSKLMGKNSNDYTTGYGGFLKFSYPVSQASDISLEVGLPCHNFSIGQRESEE